MIFIILLAVAIFYVVATYNRFVTIKKSRIKNAIQEIGNQLKRQANLIPNLTETVKGYLKHEKEIFEKITDARKSVNQALKSNDAQKMIDASTQLQTALNPIRVVLESTPEIKGAQPTVKLMDELRDTADKLTYSRRTLIDLVADYNRMVATVPSKFVALLFNFKEEPGLKMPETGEHLEVSSQELKTPKVKL
ncbi:MAG TPA: LemA family protein [Nevskiaceae bacterium]|nr:LemA family protein [Nevskiaceae bacterium]